MNKSEISRNNSLFIPRKQQNFEDEKHAKSPVTFRDKLTNKQIESSLIFSRGDTYLA